MSNLAVTIRQGRRDDVDRLLAFWRHAAEGISITDDRKGVRRLPERNAAAVLIAEVDREMVGTVIAGWDGWRCHLYRLAVSPAFRRRGIGTALLAAAEQRFMQSLA
jgi:ribosomal protein S18 acetylase RimI-like enzyme